LNDLVSDMMNLARPRPPSFGTVDVARIAHDVVQIARQSGRGEHDVPVSYEGPEHVTVRADAAQLRQIIWNLLRNAVQASGADAAVRVRVEPRGAQVSIAVVDRGLGIPVAARDRIFDAFVTTRTQGIGIGLAVVKQIVDAHDGTIAVEDTPGGGTTFRVTLSAAEEEKAS
jgi:signal transduction histidine kinase